ncbi:transcription repressor NadR [Staphylococcus sp. ACRSN]|uniref:transcription repressor NadR n=1 Tax=Staphylococcus sp. ACRSN TaxID=2918214 RepID=UPI001EF2A099|nr:transcription repressor NadR [Staphylococcus sp. ACRSN]MCG7338921.1 transcription repressor NadR [Staphylococcus sp. ACRSN]
MDTPDYRRSQILQLLKSSKQPISGKHLSERFEVSRQIIVKDISTLKSHNHTIHSTSRGYVIDYEPQGKHFKRTITCQHTQEQMAEELHIILDNGAMVDDVSIEHPLYGEIRKDLMIESHEDLHQFLQQMEKYQGKMLANLTNGLHIHTISAHTEKILDNAVRDLNEHHYIVKD